MSRRAALGVLGALGALGGCTGATGTIALELATAPGSTVLDDATRLRLTLTRPRVVREAARTASGFDLTLEAEATGESGTLIVEAFDAAGALIATGMSPPFSIAGLDAHIVVYVAAPRSIAAAPIALPVARAGVAGAPLPYGGVLAGGRDELGAPSDALAIYNAYDHSLVDGQPMPIARADLVIGANTTGGVYLFGGVDAGGGLVPSLYRFDSTVAPSGTYTALGQFPELARAGERALPIGADRFLVTGAPALELANGALGARADVPALPTVGAVATPADGLVAAVFVGGSTGLVRFRGEAFDTLPGEPARERAAIAALPDGRLVVVGGGPATEPSRDALVIDPATGAVATVAGALGLGRYAPAIAATSRHLVVAGGVDASGAPFASAEILDAHTLAPLAVTPVAPRAGAQALALANDQVLIFGGAEPTELLELFTPDPPAQGAP